MHSKTASAAQLAGLLVAFILLRVFVNLGGVAGFAFNVATFAGIFVLASTVWQRSAFHKRHERNRR